MTPHTQLIEALKERTDALRKHIVAHGGPAKDENGNVVGSIWPKILEAAELVDRLALETPSPNADQLKIEYHAGNPNLCRVTPLRIYAMPECEGGGFAVHREDAERIVGCVNAAQSTRAEALRDAAKMIRSGAGMCDLIDDDLLDQQAKNVLLLIERPLDPLIAETDLSCIEEPATAIRSLGDRG